MNLDPSLTDAQRRLLAIVLLAVPLALLAIITIPIVSSYFVQRSDVAVLARQLLAYQAAIERAPAERQAIERMRRSSSLALVFHERQASVAAAQLQSKLAQLAEKSGASVVQSTARVDTGDGALVELRSRLVAEADIEHLTRLLHAIEEAQPMLLVRRCTIRDADGAWQNAVVAQAPNRLQVELDISGFMSAS